MQAQREMTLEEVINNIVGDHVAKREYLEMKNDLTKALKYLAEGKQKFTPNTTNSFVDDLLKKYEGKF